MDRVNKKFQTLMANRIGLKNRPGMRTHFAGLFNSKSPGSY